MQFTAIVKEKDMVFSLALHHGGDADECPDLQSEVKFSEQ
jgi:hypothetical protein